MADIHYTLGIDVGQANDPTALALIESETGKKPVYKLTALHRFPLGRSYPQLVSDVSRRVNEAPLAGRTRLAIDATGVGAPIVDLFNDGVQPRSAIYAITITGGTSVGGAPQHPTVPKRDLINTTAVVLQQRRLRIARDMLDTAPLIDELLSHRVKKSESGHDSYGPASSRDHDDLLLALSLALWLAETRPFSYARISWPRGRIPARTTDRFFPLY